MVRRVPGGEVPGLVGVGEEVEVEGGGVPTEVVEGVIRTGGKDMVIKLLSTVTLH